MYGYTCRAYPVDGFGKYGPALPHSLTYKKMELLRIGYKKNLQPCQREQILIGNE